MSRVLEKFKRKSQLWVGKTLEYRRHMALLKSGYTGEDSIFELAIGCLKGLQQYHHLTYEDMIEIGYEYMRSQEKEKAGAETYVIKL